MKLGQFWPICGQDFDAFMTHGTHLYHKK